PPVHEAVQVGEPVAGIVERRARQGPLLLGHRRSVHTSSLRLNAQRTSTVPTAPLRQVAGCVRPRTTTGAPPRARHWLQAGRLRSRRAPYGSQVHGGSIDTSRTAPPVRHTRSVTGLVVGTTGVRASAHRLIPQRCRRAIRARRPDDSTLARPLTGGPTIGASCSGFFRSHRDVLASSPGRGQALPGHMVREASDEILLRVLPPALVATCALFTG